MTVSSASLSARNVALQCAARVTFCEAVVIRRLSDLRRHSGVTAFFVAASRGGDGPLWWAVGGAFLAFGGSRARWAVLTACLAVGVCVLLFLGLKRLIGRPRPFEVWEDVPCLLAPPDRYSFPSGHTITAFAIWSVFAHLVPATSVLLLPLATVIGLSRVFLGLHYPTDVLAGAVLGSGVGQGAARLADFVLR